MKRILFRIIKEIQFNTPLRRYFFPKFIYNFTAPQLCFICSCLEKTENVKGNVAEIGCFAGSTTLFLAKYLKDQKIEKKYYALDTFSGFVEEDVKVEVESRGKNLAEYKCFSINKQKWFDSTMRDNGLSRVESIKADLNKFDLSKLGNLSFALLDVDLYRPISGSLPTLLDILSPGGIIVVDDCDPNVHKWDGAYQAYMEFVEKRGMKPEIVYDKLGIIRKEK